MLRVVIALACVVAVVAPSRGFAASPKCRAEDPAAAGDADAVEAVRQQIEAACDCADFPAEGKKSKHGAYVKCAKAVVKAAVDADQLRPQCKKLALYPFAFSTCGYPAEAPRVPCLKTTRKGPVCKISKCAGENHLPCAEHADCLAAADTNHDRQVSSLDSGECNGLLDCAAITQLSQTFIDGRVVSCFDTCTDPLTFQECANGCASGGTAFESATVIRNLCLADPTVTCAELHAAALQYCATPPPLPQVCVVNCQGDPLCEAKCAEVSDCTAIADEILADCVAAEG